MSKPPLLNVRLCIFCKHFAWSKEEMWGMGSTQTGPMFDGGDATCAAGIYSAAKDYIPTRPSDDDEWRQLILTAVECLKFEERE